MTRLRSKFFAALRHRNARGWAACFAIVIGIAILVILVGWIVPTPLRLLARPSTVVRFDDLSTGFVFLSDDEKWRIHADVSQIDPDYIRALLEYEDRRFNVHPGVDPLAIVRAVYQNITDRQIVSGASTLTMQLVRVLEPRSRSLGSKIVETFRALQLELRYSKNEILVAYMTFISFGKNIEGVETAAWAYFGHGANNLTPSEIAVLLSVPQLPSRRFPDLKNGVHLRQARDKILKYLFKQGVFGKDGESLATALLVDVPVALKPFPRSAAHLAFWMNKNQEKPAGNGDLLTTIDPAVQKMIDHLSTREGRLAANQGVHNHAVVVVENATGQIKGVIGGLDFWNERAGSQIAGFQIPRSPGSLLKPFIYAQAIDLGIIVPDRMVTDIPKDYGGYVPKNYDGNFSGLVRIEDALSRSLNIPFINLLDQIGIEKFLGMIGQTGISRILKSPGYYGLSVAAGGIELSALEVAGLYTALARDGSFQPLTWRTPENSVEPTSGTMQIFSSGAAWMTRKSLKIKDRPDFPRRRDFTKAPSGVFWKTGTSFGHRDAWAAGSVGRYTVVVWFGNVDYAPSHALVGSEMAAPLLFDILENLENPMEAEDDVAPPTVAGVELCSFSGYLPGPGCPGKHKGLALVHNIPDETCPFHTEMEIEKSTGLAVGPMCRAGRATESRKFMNWPPGVRRFLGASYRHLPELPRIHPACIHIAGSDDLKIISPARNRTIIMIPGLDPAKQEIPFEVESANSVEMMSWFLNGKFLKSIKADEQLWWIPKPGSHQVSVVSASGQSVSRKFNVKSF